MSSIFCQHCHQPMRFPCPRCQQPTKALRGKWSERQSLHYTLRQCDKGHRSNWNGARVLAPFKDGRALV